MIHTCTFELSHIKFCLSEWWMTEFELHWISGPQQAGMYLKNCTMHSVTMSAELIVTIVQMHSVSVP